MENCIHLLDPSNSDYHWGLYLLAHAELHQSLNRLFMKGLWLSISKSDALFCYPSVMLFADSKTVSLELIYMLRLVLQDSSGDFLVANLWRDHAVSYLQVFLTLFQSASLSMHPIYYLPHHFSLLFVHCFYIALFSTLEQTDCAHVACDSECVTSFFITCFWISTEVVYLHLTALFD